MLGSSPPSLFFLPSPVANMHARVAGLHDRRPDQGALQQGQRKGGLPREVPRHQG